MDSDRYFSERVCERLASRPFHYHWIYSADSPVRQAIAWPLEHAAQPGGEGMNSPVGRIPLNLLVETESGSLLAFKLERYTSFPDSDVHQLVAAWRRGEEMPGWEQLEWDHFNGCVSVTQWGEGGHSNLSPLWLLGRTQTSLAASFREIDTQLAEALAVFTNRLDQEALRLARWPNPEFPSSPLLFDRKLYLYLSHPDQTVRRNRTQAFELMPRPIHLLCHSQAESWFDADCLDQIDQGNSPFATLCAREGVSRGALKHYLRHVPLLIGHKVEREPLSRMLFALDCIPPNKRPFVDRDWFVFIAVLESIEFWCFSHGGNRTDAGMPLGRSVIRDAAMIGWSQFEPWLVRHFGLNALTDAKDFVDALNGYSTGAHIRGEAVVDITTIAPAGLRGLLKLSASWHRVVNRLMLELPAPIDTAKVAHWVWPLPDAVNMGAYEIHHVGNAAELVAEGLAMKHCAAMLVTSCQSGVRRVFSLRTQDGQRCSTFDLTFNRDADKKLHIEYGDHRGMKNAEPESEWENVVQQFIEWVISDNNICLLEGDVEIGRECQHPYHTTAMDRIGAETVAQCLSEAGWVVPTKDK